MIPAVANTGTIPPGVMDGGGGPTAVGSVALAMADPPPDTLAWLITCEGALKATFTITVIVG